jgi:hypothetical protein
MDPETLEALQGSIEHWRENVALVEAGKMPLIGAIHCALCLEFNSGEDQEENCTGCPVMERTGKDSCEESPYTQVSARRDLVLRATSPTMQRLEWADLLAACKAELAFLESLLP